MEDILLRICLTSHGSIVCWYNSTLPEDEKGAAVALRIEPHRECHPSCSIPDIEALLA